NLDVPDLLAGRGIEDAEEKGVTRHQPLAVRRVGQILYLRGEPPLQGAQSQRGRGGLRRRPFGAPPRRGSREARAQDEQRRQPPTKGKAQTAERHGRVSW